jgi:hypothetical protein
MWSDQTATHYKGLHMSVDVLSVFQKYNINPNDHDTESTMAGWSYDLSGALLDDTSPFDADRSSVTRHPDDLSAMLKCTLVAMNGVSRDEALQFLMTRWYQELYYVDCLYQTFDVTTVNCIVAKNRLGITIRFIIKTS